LHIFWIERQLEQLFKVQSIASAGAGFLGSLVDKGPFFGR